MIGNRLMIPATDGTEIPLDCYIPSVYKEIDPEPRRKAVIVCPGGGYHYVSPREAEPVALTLAAAGFNAFVVWYRVAPHRDPLPRLDVGAAVAYVREHAQELHTDPNAIAVMGFSAGGHVAASVGTQWQEPELWQPYGLSPQQVQPNAMVLCYPVISGGKFAHRGSFEMLTGTGNTVKHLPFSMEEKVTSACPPTFLWHTFPDESVSVMNSLLMAQALTRCGVTTELHVFPEGGHGSSLCSPQSSGTVGARHTNPDNAVWMEMAQRFLKKCM